MVKNMFPSLNVIIQWDFIRIIFIVVIIASLLIGLSFIFFYIKAVKHYRNKNYDKVLKYTKILKFFPNKNHKYSGFATIYRSYVFLNKNEIDHFVTEVDQLKYKDLIYFKHYWNSFIAYYKDDTILAENHYNKFLESKPRTIQYPQYEYNNLNIYLSAIKLFNDSKYDESNELLVSIRDNLTSELEKEYCEKLINKISNM